jgi:3alpha(or 20beta)-hydroxysteroid dehydrogenase
MSRTADGSLPLDGRVAIISGAARGIGAATAKCFVDAGARVVLGDVLDDEGRACAQSLGARAAYLHLDVRERVDWEQAAATCDELFGAPASVLVHNAGVMTPGSVVSTDEARLRTAYDINVVGAVIGTQVCVPGMMRVGYGSIVVVSSIASVSVGPGFIPYALSKAANAAFARAAARELGQLGIRVNSLHPGGVETPMNTGEDFAALDKEAWFSRMAIPRIGRPEEIADAALYLACEQSSYVTGIGLIVDGGQLLGPVGAWSELPGGLNELSISTKPNHEAIVE